MMTVDEYINDIRQKNIAKAKKREQQAVLHREAMALHEDTRNLMDAFQSYVGREVSVTPVPDDTYYIEDRFTYENDCDPIFSELRVLAAQFNCEVRFNMPRTIYGMQYKANRMNVDIERDEKSGKYLIQPDVKFH